MSAFEWLQHKLTRRTAIKGAVVGTAVGTAGFIGADMHLAVQDAAAEDYRPLTDAEWDRYFDSASPAGKSQLVDPWEGAPQELIDAGWFLGIEGWMIEDEAFRQEAIAFDLARVDAWHRKDRAWFTQHAQVRMPVKPMMDHADAHYCSYETGYPKASGNCPVTARETRPSSSCGGYSCWILYWCSDGHSRWCRAFCGVCTA